MFKVLVTLSVLVAVAHCYPGATVYAYQKPAAPLALEKEIEIKEKFAPPKYEYKYGVEDLKTGDKKSKYETREGDSVKGEYTLIEPDGTKRIVKYTSKGKEGFIAEVIKEGKPILPPPKKY